MAETTITLVVLAVAAILAYWAFRSTHGRRLSLGGLEDKYGNEFRMLRHQLGSDTAAGREIERREERVSRYDIRELGPQERQAFHDEWIGLQARFVDDPQGAILAAESLLARVMSARGYPLNGFEQSAEDLSVDHARFMDAFREAHGIALAARADTATTDDLRRGMMLYRAMFADLLAH